MITSSAYMRRFTCGKKSLKNLKKHQRKWTLNRYYGRTKKKTDQEANHLH